MRMDKSTRVGTTEKAQDRVLGKVLNCPQVLSCQDLCRRPQHTVFLYECSMGTLLWNKAKILLEHEWTIMIFIKWNLNKSFRTERGPFGRGIGHEDNIQSLQFFIKKESQTFCLGPCLCKSVFLMSLQCNRQKLFKV